MPGASKLSRLSRSGSAANSSSSRLDRSLFARPLRAAHNARPRQLPPRLDLRAHAPETSGPMRSPHPAAAADAATGSQSAKEERWSPAALRPDRSSLLAWAFRSFIVAPFSIPSGSMLPTLYIGDYLVVAKWPYGYSRYSFPFGSRRSAAGFSATCPSAATSSSSATRARMPTSSSASSGFPATRSRCAAGRLILNGRSVPREQLPPVECAVSANSPCRIVPPATPFVGVGVGPRFCVYPAYRETLPGGPSYTVLDQVDDGPADDFPAIAGPAGPRLPDGRQSRRQPRQPLFAGAKAGSAWFPSKI